MRDVTLIFLRRGNEICLAMKKRGFGQGKYNGIGGKVEAGETIPGAAIRELEEEVLVQARAADLKSVGHLDFYFEDNPDWNQRMHIFFLEQWKGEPTETDEMAPHWYSLEHIPYDTMWVDDPLWLPKALHGESIAGAFYFTDGGATISKYTFHKS